MTYKLSMDGFRIMRSDGTVALEGPLYDWDKIIDELNRLAAENTELKERLHSLSAGPGLDLTQFEGITPGEWKWAGDDLPTHSQLYRGDYIGQYDSILYHGADWSITPADKNAIASVPKLIAEVRRLRAEMARKDEVLRRNAESHESIAEMVKNRHMISEAGFQAIVDQCIKYAGIALAALKEPQQ